MKRCINAKGYKLTVGKEYEATSSGSYLVLINDVGVESRYHSSLFEEVIVEVPKTAEEIHQEFIDSISMEKIDSGLSIRWIKGVENSARAIDLFKSGTNISCGVHQISGIDNLDYELHNSSLTVEEKRVICNKIIDWIIDYNQELTGLILLSADIGHYEEEDEDGDVGKVEILELISRDADYVDHDSHFKTALTERANSFIDAWNPNSYNIIRTWSIVIHNVPNE